MVANMTKYFAAEVLILAAGSSVIQESTNLTVNHWQRNTKLCCIVGDHHNLVLVQDWMTEQTNGKCEVRQEETEWS